MKIYLKAKLKKWLLTAVLKVSTVVFMSSNRSKNCHRKTNINPQNCWLGAYKKSLLIQGFCFFKIYIFHL